MEVLFLLSMICLILFMLLGMYDGLYLHLWKYELFNREESLFEHKTHTIRALLFPLIAWALFFDTNIVVFGIGLFLVLIDLIVLGVDAYAEGESRSFMGGLPKWEYILHLFANSLHFAAIILIVATRLDIGPEGITYSTAFASFKGFETVQFIAINILPGSVVQGLAHVFLMTTPGRQFWNRYRLKITCC